MAADNSHGGQIIGQGELVAPVARLWAELPDEQLPISTAIDNRGARLVVQLAYTTQADVQMFSPGHISTALYTRNVEPWRPDRNEYAGVILPDREFPVIASAVQAIRGDKTAVLPPAATSIVEQAAAGAEPVEFALQGLKGLQAGLGEEYIALGALLSALEHPGLRRHKAWRLDQILQTAESAILDTTEVAAATYAWDEAMVARAQAAILFQLYAPSESRRNPHHAWRRYGQVADRYVRERMVVAHRLRKRLENKLGRQANHTTNG